MKILNCQNQNSSQPGLIELVERLYAPYPVFIEAKVRSIKHGLNPQNPFLKHGSWQCFVAQDDNGRILAHITAITDSRLEKDEALIGFFESEKNPETAKGVLRAAIEYLHKQGKAIIRGPVNLTTWQDFRVSFPETSQPFFMEPFTREYYRDFFRESGFTVIQKNFSLTESLEQTGFAANQTAYEKLCVDGFSFEQVRTQDRAAWQAIHHITAEAFDGTLSFIKIGLDEFIYNLAPAAVMVSQALIWLVYNPDRKPVAFFLSFPDFYSPSKKRVVAKTMGVLPAYQKLGIGKSLFYLLYQAAKNQNYTELVFSTLREDNRKIFRLTKSDATILRSYEVYELKLAS